MDLCGRKALGSGLVRQVGGVGLLFRVHLDVSRCRWSRSDENMSQGQTGVGEKRLRRRRRDLRRSSRTWVIRSSSLLRCSSRRVGRWRCHAVVSPVFLGEIPTRSTELRSGDTVNVPGMKTETYELPFYTTFPGFVDTSMMWSLCQTWFSKARFGKACIFHSEVSPRMHCDEVSGKKWMQMNIMDKKKYWLWTNLVQWGLVLIE